MSHDRYHSFDLTVKHPNDWNELARKGKLRVKRIRKLKSMVRAKT